MFLSLGTVGLEVLVGLIKIEITFVQQSSFQNRSKRRRKKSQQRKKMKKEGWKISDKGKITGFKRMM